MRGLSREGIGTRVDAVLAAQDLLQGVLLILLAAELTRCALLGQPEGFVLVFGGGCIELPRVGLVGKLVHRVGLVDEVLIVALQPVGDLGDCGGRRVLRLAAAAHGQVLIAINGFWFEHAVTTKGRA